MSNRRPVDEKLYKPYEIIKGIKDGAIVPIKGMKKFNYYIDKQGRVFSITKEVPEQLPAKANSSGDYIVNLFVKYYKTFRTSELVLLTFHPESPKEDSEPIHIDGNGRNDHISNLKWGSFASAMDLRSGGAQAANRVQEKLNQNEVREPRRNEPLSSAKEMRERQLLEVIQRLHTALEPFAKFYAFNDEEDIEGSRIIVEAANRHGQSRLLQKDLRQARDVYQKTKEYS